jgi:ABC-2 type transport system permease protein
VSASSEQSQHADEPASAMGPLLRFEWTKMMGRRITWLPFLVLTIVVILIISVFHHVQFTIHKQIFKSFDFNFRDKSEFVNGYYMAAHAMNPVFQMLIPIFISVASGLMVAGEAEQGTLRACLIRPVTRRRLILGKFLMLCGYSLALSFFVLVLLLAGGIANFGTGNLYTLNVIFNNGMDGASMVPEAELPMRFLLAALLASAGMAVLSALALLISALVDTAAMAYVLTLSIYFAVLTLRALPFLDWLYPYLFVTHMLRWQQCFYSYIKNGEIYVSLIHLTGYLVALLSASMLLFEERDIKS